jgi:hypothetical protein
VAAEAADPVVEVIDGDKQHVGLGGSGGGQRGGAQGGKEGSLSALQP